MCHDKDALIEFLYGELQPGARRAFEQHLDACEPCRSEVSALVAVRDDLLAWSPPECHELPSSWSQAPAAPAAWRAWMPVFGLAAAAALVLAASAAIANLEIRYDQQGLVVRTGRAEAPVISGAVPQAAPVPAITASDLAALEARLMTTFDAPARTGVQPVALTSDNPRLSRDMRRLIEESETRVRREMAARLLDIYNEWDATRRADFLRMQQVVGQVQSRTGADIAQMNRMILASQPQAQAPR
ncbi:MAG: zf-HC2 domain-containing protein [Acidobacteriota bacterium]|nr:zf-HC2 domain-containing protein [Acidobacteriota bacterium]